MLDACCRYIDVMSSKATKSIKRVSSLSKNRDRKAGATPDASTHGTSSACSDNTSQEKPHQSTIDDVLKGEDVQALRIKEEDLSKLHQSKLFEGDHKPKNTKRVFVKRLQPKASDEQVTTKQRRVAVLHPLPPGADVSEIRTLGFTSSGPRFNKEGTFVSHSVLGSSRDYGKEMRTRGMASSSGVFDQPPPVVLPDVKKSKQIKTTTYSETVLPREKNALEHWERSMELRRSQQRHLSEKLGTSPDRLAMNQGDHFRTVQEERMLVDRAMPSVNYGKGYRVGSEFWSQQVRIGDEDTGINTTLTRTERGLPPELEFVGIPTVVKREKGDMDRNTPLYCTWKQSAYYSLRRDELSDTIRDVQPFRPELSELQVVSGNKYGHDGQQYSPHPGDTMRLRTDSLDSQGEYDSISSSDGEELPVSLIDMHPDSVTQRLVGPALSVGGHLLKWEGPPLPQSSSNKISTHTRAIKSEADLGRVTVEHHSSTVSLNDQMYQLKTQKNKSSLPLSLRVTFESSTGEMTTSYLEMENCGTTSVYYSWQSIPKPNPLGRIQEGDIQRFYFDARGGVLLPGQKLSFPFMFKSPDAGIFSELWSLRTGPVLCRGNPVIITLKGVACQEDLYSGKRQEIESLLTNRMAISAAERIVSGVVDDIRTPPQTPVPFETTILEENAFKDKNPGIYYHYNIVQHLKMLYDSILRPELLQEEVVPHEPSTKSDKGAAGKKGDERSAGGAGKKAGGKDKEKKGSKVSQEPVKETLPERGEEPPSEVVSQVPDWDLSISSLQNVVMSVEDSEAREGKLKLLSNLVGALSFPAPAVTTNRLYNIGYVTLCEAVDSISEVSDHLCVVMGLPLKEYTVSSATGIPTTKGIDHEDTKTPSIPSSPAQTGKGKKGGKDGKKGDTKQKALASKEKERAGSSSKVKPAKSKITASPKDQSQGSGETVPTPTNTNIDPVLVKKYKANFYTAVYELLGAATETMANMFEELID